MPLIGHVLNATWFLQCALRQQPPVIPLGKSISQPINERGCQIVCSAVAAQSTTLFYFVKFEWVSPFFKFIVQQHSRISV